MIQIRYTLPFFILLLMVSQVSAINDDAWPEDLADWGFRVPITITDAPTAAGVQRMINVTYQENMQADFDDIRFRTSSGSSIDYWIEEKTDSSYADVWVKLPAADMAYIYVYFSNADCDSISDVNDVYNFYDDFEDDAVNTDKWDISLLGSAEEINGELVTTGKYYGSSWPPYTYAARDYCNITGAYQAEAKLRYSNTGTGTIFLYLYNTSGYAYGGIQDSWAAVYSGFKLANVNGTSGGTATKNQVGTESHIVKIIRDSEGSTSVYIDDVFYASGTFTGTIKEIRLTNLRYSSYSGCTGYWDYVFVRKYDPADTTFLLGATEEIPEYNTINFPGYDIPPTDPDSDGLYEDCNGNSRIDFQDIMLFFQYNKWAANNQPNASCFDWSGNGDIEFSDVQAFWEAEFT